MIHAGSQKLPLGLAVASLALALSGCSVIGTPSQTQQLTGQPTIQPTPPPPSPTPPPTPTGLATVTASPTDAETSGPPAGQLALPDGTVVEGGMGSWCYDNACLDGGPRPLRVLPLVTIGSADVRLTFMLATTSAFTYWQASYSIGDDEAGAHGLGSGGIEYDPDLSTHTPGPDLSNFDFDGPPAGDWRLEIHLQFADSRGSAVYYWHAVVP